MTKTGDAVESGFGPVQVKVTKVSGKITEITYLQSVATHGRAAAFPYLVQYAIQANGSGFGNLSGATYTTNAFKQSLESALAKF
ncbi:MAG: FMN-binding protein [Micrococcales bacterium]